MIKSLAQNWYTQRWHRWLDKRIPAHDKQQMNLNSIFILPTGFGWAFIVMAMTLFLLGTNYQNNLMLLLCYLLLSIMLLTLFYTHQNFSHLAVKAQPVEPFHCHQSGQLVLQVIPHLQHRNKFVHGQLMATWLSAPNAQSFASTPKEKMPIFSINSNKEKKTLYIPLMCKKRGMHRLPRLTLACDFPLGLFKCWTHLDFNLQVTVYPKPIEGEVNRTFAEDEEDESASSVQFSNTSDFYALTDYYIGQPLNRVAWKQVAKNGSWVVKQFASSHNDITVLSVSDNIDIETAISMLTHHILLLSEANAIFGVSFRLINIAPNSGNEHKKACLEALSRLENKTSPNVNNYTAFNNQRGAPKPNLRQYK